MARASIVTGIMISVIPEGPFAALPRETP